MIPVAVSACLLGEPVRYDGASKPAAHLRALPGIRWLSVCPEVELGLGVPRPPIHLTAAGRLVAVDGPADHTDAMRTLAEARVRALLAAGARGAVLKARSPSCGVGDAPHGALEQGDGVFAATWRRLAPGRPLCSDEDLRDPADAARFLVALVQ